MNKPIPEALTVDQSGRDISHIAGFSLNKKILALRQFQFIKNVSDQIRTEMEKNIKTFYSQEIPDVVQQSWAQLIESIGQAINILGLTAISFAVSRKEDSQIPQLKQDAINKFKSSQISQKLTQQINELKNNGVDASVYSKILNDSTQNIVDGLFKLQPDDLSRFVADLAVGNEIKTKLLNVIKSNRISLTPKDEQGQTAAGIPSKKQAREPQIDAKQVSSDFKKFMEMMRDKYGPQSLQLVSKEIQNLMQPPKQTMK
jgi:hypothetical protein